MTKRALWSVWTPVWTSMWTLSALGCGSAAARSEPAALPAETGAELAADKPSDASRPARPGDLEVVLDGPRRIGELRDDHVSEHPMTITVRNRTGEVLRLGPTLATVEVFEGTTRVAGCERGNVLADLPELLAPSGVALAVVEMPCGLAEHGEYDVVVTLVPGHRDSDPVSAADVRFVASTPLVVDDDIAPLGTARTPPARVYAPHPSTLATPVPHDVRPEPDPAEPPSGPAPR